jgi:hypothetical protein
MKKADTLGTLDKGSVEFLEQMTGNPNSWGSAPEEKLRAIKTSTLRDVEMKAGKSGLSYTPEAKTFQGGTGGGLAGSGAMSDKPITLINPQGKEFKVHPSRAQALRNAGWSDPTVAGGSYIARPTDLYAGGGQ